MLGNGMFEGYGFVFGYLKDENSCFIIYEIWAREDVQKVTSINNCNAVHLTNNLVSHHIAANSTEQNPNMGTCASGCNAQISKLVL